MCASPVINREYPVSKSDEWCATTDAAGHYAITGLEHNEYRVEFSDLELHDLTQFYADQSSFFEATPVSVATGGVTSGIDAALREAGRVTGTITNKSTHAPVVGIEVCAGRHVEDGEKYWCATTGANGEYTIVGLEPGGYFVGVNVGAFNYLPSTPEHEYRVGVEVKTEQTVSGANLELTEGGEISGIVTSAATGLPVADIDVCAEGNGPPFETRCATTNALGEYTVAGLETSSYTLHFVPQRPYLSQAYQQETALHVTQGSTLTGVDASLVTGGAISGQVKSASTGLAMPGVEVCDNEGTSRFCVETDSNGDYELTGLATGQDIVEFSPKEDAYQYGFQYYDDQEVYERANRVSVTAGQTTSGIDAELRAKYGQITGRVTEHGTQKPGILKVCARNLRSGEERCTEPNTTGEYDLTHLVSGEYSVEFSAPGDMFEVGRGWQLRFPTQYYDGRWLASEADPVDVSAGFTTAEINAELIEQEPSDVEISGRVTDASTHASIAGIEACAYQASGEELFGGCAKTDAEGVYVIENLPGGQYIVEFSSPPTSTLDYVPQVLQGFIIPVRSAARPGRMGRPGDGYRRAIAAGRSH